MHDKLKEVSKKIGVNRNRSERSLLGKVGLEEVVEGGRNKASCASKQGIRSNSSNQESVLRRGKKNKRKSKEVLSKRGFGFDLQCRGFGR